MLLLIAILSMVVCFVNADHYNCSAPQVQASGFTFTKNKAWYGALTGFLSGLHGDKIPYDDVSDLIKYLQDKGNDIWPKLKPLFINQVGFFIFMLIGILLTLILPIVGICFCSFRLCDKCGGKRIQQKPTKRCRWILSGGLGVCFTLLLFGTVMFGISGGQFDDGLKKMPANLVDITQNLVDVITGIIDQFVCLVTAFTKTVEDYVNYVTLYPAQVIDVYKTDGGYDDLQIVANLQKKLATETNDASNLRPILYTDTTKFDAGFNDFFDKVADKFPANYRTQVSAELNTYLEELTKLQQKLADATKASNDLDKLGLETTVGKLGEKLDKVLKDIMENIGPELESLQDSVVSGLEETQKQLTMIGSNLTDPMKTFRNGAENFQDRFEESLDSWNWVLVLIRVIFLFILCLILLLLVAAVVLGLVRYKPHERPSKRGFLSNTGGNMLIGSVALMFIFAGFFMLVSCLLFIVAYPVQYVCEPLFFDDSLKIYGLINDFTTIGNVTIDIQQALKNCKEGNTAFSSWNIDEIINLNKTVKEIEDWSLDPGQIVSELSFAKLHYDLDCTSLLTVAQELETSSKSLYASAAVLLPFAPKTHLILSNITKALAGDPLESEAEAQTKKFDQLEANYNKLSLLIIHTSADSNNITSHSKLACDKYGNLTKTIDDLHKSVNHQFPAFATELVDQAQQWMSLFQTTVGSCTTVYDLFEDFGTVGCKQLLYPIHGVWGSIGWCAIIFVPTIIFAVRLAKYQRNMKFDGDFAHVRRASDSYAMY